MAITMRIEDGSFEKRTTAKGTVIFFQTGWLKGEYVAGRVRRSVFEQSDLLAPGEYEMDVDKSLQISQYGDVQLSRDIVWKRVRPIQAARTGTAG